MENTTGRQSAAVSLTATRKWTDFDDGTVDNGKPVGYRKKRKPRVGNDGHSGSAGLWVNHFGSLDYLLSVLVGLDTAQSRPQWRSEKTATGETSIRYGVVYGACDHKEMSFGSCWWRRHR